MDEELRRAVEELERSRWAVQLTDHEWRLVWASRELCSLLGTSDEDELGYGRHVLEAYLLDAWRGTITEESQLEQFARDVPFMVADTPGGKEALARILPDEARGWLEDMEPRPIPPVWSSELQFVQADLPPVSVRVLNAQLGHSEGGRLGVMRIYGSALPATLLSLVGRGDQVMFERMARLVAPGRRQAAILFADLQASGDLARRLSSAAYFSLMRDLTTAIDEAVVRHGGIVGKHAGDGVTAFFLEEDAGSVSAAARAAIEAGREIAAVTRSQAVEALFNVGLHWGGTLYMGQVVTGGRIEVTALGDEVNEAARVEQVARDGEVLATKPLLERLADEDADRLALAPEELGYSPLAERPGASEKAIRDAGGLAVTDVRA